MEAFRCLLDEIDTSLRLGDVADCLHGFAVIERGIAALANNSDAVFRLSSGLVALRALHAQHEREGRTDLAADAAHWIVEVEQRVSELARLAEAETWRQGRTN